MPRGDGTGPMGNGPMTGRGAGYCAGTEAPGYVNPVPGRCFGMGFGGGRGAGRRNRFYAASFPRGGRFGGNVPRYGFSGPYVTPDPEQEKQTLKNQAEALQAEIDAIKKRLAEM